MSHARISALFIDIDDTLIRLKPGYALPPLRHAEHWSGSLLEVLYRAGVELGGLSDAECSARIQRTKAEIRWWLISDFILPLGLDSAQFWKFAHDRERIYIEPAATDLQTILLGLKRSGFQLYITSNNPLDAILHKLRLAGITDTNLFEAFFGASELRAMKWEPAFWERALARTGLDPRVVAVIGDNPRDDCAIPQAAGIGHAFLVNTAPPADRTQPAPSISPPARSWTEIAALLMPDARGLS